MHAQHVACARAPPSQRIQTQRHAHTPARLAPPSACKPGNRRSALVAGASLRVVAAALTEQDLTKRALRLDTFEAPAVSEVRAQQRWQAQSLLTTSLGACAASGRARSRRRRVRRCYTGVASARPQAGRRKGDGEGATQLTRRSRVSLTRCAVAGPVLSGVARQGLCEAYRRRSGDRGGNWQSAAAGRA